ncbi:CinA family protein [bacterium]|nr:CinA family protein [bacterium]
MILEEELGQILKENNLTISTAESCTGGLVSSRLTDVSGSSDYIKLNFVTYANEAKNSVLGVNWDILNNYGAVSEECSQAMAEGLSKITNADVVICTTGIAGPTGGTVDKPVGLMFASVKYKGIITVKEIRLPQYYSRIKMKQRFSDEALKLAISVLKNNRIA